MTKRKLKYKGLLKKPIEIGLTAITRKSSEQTSDADGALSAQKVTQLLNNQYIEKCIKKMPLLFEHYKIEDKTDFEHLALCLAIDHVDGFRAKEVQLYLKHGDYGAVVSDKNKLAGRPKIWSDAKLIELYEDVQSIKQIKAIKKDRDALLHLRNKPKWQSSNFSEGATAWIETLESRLYDAKVLIKRRKKVEVSAKDLIKQVENLKEVFPKKIK